MCVDVTDFCTVDFACYPNTITPKRERAVHSIRLESRFRVLIGIFESIGDQTKISDFGSYLK